MPNMLDIETRMERLERANRRWRLGAAGLLGAIGLAGMGALQPVDARPPTQREMADRGDDPGFGITFRGSPEDTLRRQMLDLVSTVPAQNQRIDEMSAALKALEQRVAALERIKVVGKRPMVSRSADVPSDAVHP
jgi:hypothetical protein